jgi:transcriptional regulator with XRE-family HTH domain
MKQPHSSFSQALQRVRRARGVTQEEFDLISSRTYISALERGIKQPTLTKVDSLAAVMKVHPLTLLAFSYCGARASTELASLLKRVAAEAEAILTGESAR